MQNKATAFAKIMCPFCSDPQGFEIISGKSFQCSSCKAKCKCPQCYQYDQLMFINNDVKSYFICRTCKTHFEWNDEGEISYKINKINMCKCNDCNKEWNFLSENSDAPYWFCECGTLMLPNDGLVKQLKNLNNANNKQKNNKQKITPMSEHKSSVSISLEEYQEFTKFKFYKQEWEQFKIFLDNKVDINAAMSKIIATFQYIREQCDLQGFSEDLEDLETSITDLDGYFSQIFTSETDLWEQYDIDVKEIEDWKKKYEDEDDYYDDIEEPTLIYDRVPFTVSKKSKQSYLKEIYSEIVIEDDSKDLNDYLLKVKSYNIDNDPYVYD